MLWVLDCWKYFFFSVRGSSLYVKIWRLKTNLALKKNNIFLTVQAPKHRYLNESERVFMMISICCRTIKCVSLTTMLAQHRTSILLTGYVFYTAHWQLSDERPRHICTSPVLIHAEHGSRLRAANHMAKWRCQDTAVHPSAWGLILDVRFWRIKTSKSNV